MGDIKTYIKMCYEDLDKFVRLMQHNRNKKIKLELILQDFPVLFVDFKKALDNLKSDKKV